MQDLSPGLSGLGDRCRYPAYQAKSMSLNPYTSPDDSNQELAEDPVVELHENLGLGSKLSLIISISCLIYALHLTLQTVREFKFLFETYGSWSGLHYLAIVQSLLIPALLVFSVITGRLSIHMNASRKSKTKEQFNNELLSNINWLLLGLMLFVIVAIAEMLVLHYLSKFGY